jgi:hypothetical protein
MYILYCFIYFKLLKIGSFVSVSSSFTNSSQMRDAYGLNNSSFSDTSSFNGDDVGYDDISIDSRRSKQASSTNNLMTSLKNLPAPEYTYDISLPTTNDNDESIDESKSFVEDATDIMERELNIKKQNELIELERRSTVIKRNLPRPSYISKSLKHSSKYIDIHNEINYSFLNYYLILTS